MALRNWNTNNLAAKHAARIHLKDQIKEERSRMAKQYKILLVPTHPDLNREDYDAAFDAAVDAGFMVFSILEPVGTRHTGQNLAKVELVDEIVFISGPECDSFVEEVIRLGVLADKKMRIWGEDEDDTVILHDPKREGPILSAWLEGQSALLNVHIEGGESQ